jgi:hypothetical protein
MGEYWGLVHGVSLDADGEKRQMSDGLLSPVAVFKGLKRPLHNLTSDADRKVFVYFSNPQNTFNYPRANQYSGGPLERKPAPIDSVFAVYVTFDRGHIDAECGSMSQDDQPVGLVVGWEWLEASSRVKSLPYDYDSRFDARVI